MSIFKIAMIQQKAIPNNIGGNLRLAVEYIERAYRMGADLVLFPEMWSNGYAPPFEGAFDDPFNVIFEKERTVWLNNAILPDSQYIRTLKNAAKKFNIGVVATYLSKTISKPQNTAVIIDRTGKTILEYAKVHTCDFSLEALLQNGKEFKVCEFDGVRLGVMICYDREFPESARVLMLKGAEIILVPNACGMNPARINQLSTRAFENMAGIVMANYPGPGWGCSCAFSPIIFDDNGNYIDNAIAGADDVSEEILMAQFNLGKIRTYRKTETWGNAFRKPQAYGDLVGREIKEPFKRRR